MCMTEEARDVIRKRNNDITKRIKAKVSNMVKKTASSWKSLGSEIEVEETFIRNVRSLFEVEIYLPASLLGEDRELSDRSANNVRDGYVDLLPEFETYENISMNQICKSIQTHLVGREVSAQTYPGYPKNAWTQYEYEYDISESLETDVIVEDEQCLAVDKDSSLMQREFQENIEGVLVTEELEEQKIKKPKPVEVFLEARSKEMIEIVRYNTVINIHAHDVTNLAQTNYKNRKSVNPMEYVEYKSFIDLSFTKGKVISDVSWHPSLTGIMAICYAEISGCDIMQRSSCIRENIETPRGSTAGVLIWSFTDSLYPKLLLVSDQEIHSVSFCPFQENIIIGGCANGQIIIWYLNDYLTKEKMDDKCNEHFTTEISNGAELWDLKNVPIVSAIAVSDKNQSHNFFIRKIQWISPYYRVESDGRLTELSENSSSQFMTASEDGCIAVWDLCWEPSSTSSSQNAKTTVKTASSLSSNKDLKSFDGMFKPVYRLFVQVPKETRYLHPLALYVPLSKVILQKIHDKESTEEKFNLSAVRKFELKFNQKVKFLKQLWIGTLEGDLINCTWKGHEFSVEGASSENCQFLSHSYVHDGPVTNITSSPHLHDVLLTIGGHVFAVWKDDYLQSPLLWRKCQYRYTACCWSGKPAVFLVARDDGAFEVWDIRSNTNEPIFVQTVSGKCITGLYLYESFIQANVIGVCDYSGAFRVFREPENQVTDFDERIKWFEDFVVREVSRKKEFTFWQDNYLKNDQLALDRKSARIAEEAKRKHEEAREKFQKEQEELARLEMERKARQLPKSKSMIWKLADHKRRQEVLLEKKGFVPWNLEKARQPLVKQQEEKKWKLVKAKKEITIREKYFNDAISMEFPEYRKETVSKIIDDAILEKTLDEVKEKDKQAFLQIQKEARRILTENPRVLKFDWNAVMREGKQRRRFLDVEDMKNCRKEERLRCAKPEQLD